MAYRFVKQWYRRICLYYGSMLLGDSFYLEADKTDDHPTTAYRALLLKYLYEKNTLMLQRKRTNLLDNSKRTRLK